MAAATQVETTVVPTEQPGFFALNFEIQRGNSKTDMGTERTPRLIRRMLSDEEQASSPLFERGRKVWRRDFFEMTLENADTFYLTELEIGSNGDKNQVLVDTGSSDLWVMAHDVDCHAESSSASTKKRDLGLHVGDIFVHPHEDSISPTKTEKLQGKANANSILSAFGITTDSPFGGSGGSGSGSGSAVAVAVATDSGSTTNTCTSYGSFNTANSESFTRNSSAPAFSIRYADGTSAEGIWGYDDVKISNATVNNLSFAVSNDTSSNIGVLGIGLAMLEVTYSSGTSNAYTYENLPARLASQNIIAKNAYSLYLGSSDSKTGTVLFGAVDHAKYSGTLQTVPIVNTLESYGYESPIRLEINVDEISLTNSDSVQVNSNGYTALLDSGSTLSYFPQSLLEKTASTLGLDYSNSVGAYLIDCDVSGDTSIDFTFSGINISCPISHFVVQVTSGTCAFGILAQSSSSDYLLLGDNFLRNAYVVYDLEDLTISLAQVNHSDEEDIEVISSNIPQASSVVSAATAANSGGSESTASGSVTLSNSDTDSSRDSGAIRMVPKLMTAAAFVGVILAL
ncbi:aspartyl protease [Yamadazyma tenuis]|nr:aspartyl protease [Yamadazyma tenuis]